MSQFYEIDMKIEFIILGIRPKRTIVFCSWGAEEHGLFGSTEWVEVIILYATTFDMTCLHL